MPHAAFLQASMTKIKDKIMRRAGLLGIFLVLAYLHVMRRLETGQQPDPAGQA